jgi:hypothetical protein
MHLFDRAGNKFANRIRSSRVIFFQCAFQCAALISVISWVLVCNGCSGGSGPGSSTASSTNLTISATLPGASVGSSYNGSVSVAGGSAPYTFSTASGELPPGVALNQSTGAVSGTPTASGNFNFSVSVADSKGLSKQQALKIVVASGSSAAVTVTPPTASVASGGTAQFSAAVSNASSAVTWTASQGTISSAGLYSAPQVSANTTVTISAASVADPNEIATASVTITPPPSNSGNSSASNGNSVSNLQRSGGWGQYGQRAPAFADCSPSPCNGISFSMGQGIQSPSLSGNATIFNVGGSVPFSDGLWNNHLIGNGSSQGMPDGNQTLVPTLHDFTYDVYFYGDNLGLSQALEFDINQFVNGMGFIFGHECRIAGGNEWDVWDNQNAYWKHTGIPCYPNSNSWNHLTIKVQRTSNNELVYQSITLNGNTSTLNWTFPPGSANGWYGVTINYQMDGDENQDSYNVYLDQLTFSYQ